VGRGLVYGHRKCSGPKAHSNNPIVFDKPLSSSEPLMLWEAAVAEQSLGFGARSWIE
ncbi:unnamed protein product, partial [Dovyalis caffra]